MKEEMEQEIQEILGDVGIDDEMDEVDIDSLDIDDEEKQRELERTKKSSSDGRAPTRTT